MAPPSLAPSPPPAWPALVSVWQALGPVRRPVGCDGQQLCVPLPAVWHPLGSCPGAQHAKVTSVQLRKRKKEECKKIKINKITGHGLFLFCFCWTMLQQKVSQLANRLFYNESSCYTQNIKVINTLSVAAQKTDESLF